MVYSVLGTVGPRAAAAPVALSFGNGGSQQCEAVDDTAQACVTCLCFGNICHVELDDLPDSNNSKSKRYPLLLAEFVWFDLIRIKTPKKGLIDG